MISGAVYWGYREGRRVRKVADEVRSQEPDSLSEFLKDHPKANEDDKDHDEVQEAIREVESRKKERRERRRERRVQEIGETVTRAGVDSPRGAIRVLIDEYGLVLTDEYELLIGGFSPSILGGGLKSHFSRFVRADDMELCIYEEMRKDVLNETQRGMVRGYVNRHGSSYNRRLERNTNLAELLQDEGLPYESSDHSRLRGFVGWMVEQESKLQELEKLRETVVDGATDADDIIARYVELKGVGPGSDLSKLQQLLYRSGNFRRIYGIQRAVKRYSERAERERNKEALLSAADVGPTVNIDGMSGEQFEDFLETVFEDRGFDIEETPSTDDQGADLIAKKFGQKTVVQAKRYRGSVGNKAIQEVISAREYYNADEAIVVTNSTFTDSATELAEASGVELWNGAKLERVIRGDD